MAGKRGNISNLMTWIIMILLIVGLAGFGVTNFGSSVNSVGAVGKTQIDVNRYARTLDQELARISETFGRRMTVAEAQQFGVTNSVMQSIMDAVAYEDESTRIGLSVGDQEVQKRVVTAQNFQNINGEFDREQYEFALRQLGFSAREFEDQLRVEISRGLLEASVTNGLAVPAVYTDIISQYVGERRNFTWVALEERDLENPLATPSDADVRAYYDDNVDAFMLPETKRLTTALLSPDQLVETIAVDDAALREIYDSRSEVYNTPERRLVERLVFATEADANTAASQIADGATTFEELVASRGLTLADVDLGDVSVDDLDDAGDTVFSLTDPGMAGPAETGLGPALFRVNAILAAQSTAFEDVRDELMAEETLDRARRQIDNEYTYLEDLLAGGATLEELTGETDMVLGQYLWDESSSEGLAAYESFTIAAQAIQDGDFPEIIPLEDGGLFAIRLDEVIEPRPEPFEDAKARAAEELYNIRLVDALQAQAKTMKTEVENGASISAFGLPASVETHMIRSSYLDDAPTTLLNEMFGAATNDVVILADGNRVIISELREILPPAEDDPSIVSFMSTLTDEHRRGIAEDIRAAFSNAVQQSSGITIDQAALNSVHAQFTTP